LKKLVTINALLIFLAAGLTLAHVKAEATRAAKFSSVYTDLKTQCASALSRKEEKESEAMGEDIPLLCKGYGGYEIHLASHAAITQLQVQRKADKEAVLTETMYFSDPIYTRKVEWRLADGQPFAVIFRRDIHDETDDPATAKKIGEALRVIGLKDKKIDFWVDVKKFANPNEEARRLADGAYAK